MQHEAEHQENQQIGVQAGNDTQEWLGSEGRYHPSGRQQTNQRRKDRGVLQPLPGALPLRRRFGLVIEVNAQILGCSDGTAAGSREVGDHRSQCDQKNAGQHRLPGEDGLAEVEDSSDLQQCRRKGGGRGLELGGRGRQAKCPDGAQAHKRCGAERTVVDVQVPAARDGPGQESAEDDAESPVQYGD